MKTQMGLQEEIFQRELTLIISTKKMRNYSKKVNDKTAQIIGYKTQKERIQNTEIWSFVKSKKSYFTLNQ
jgi:hypothetical protein